MNQSTFLDVIIPFRYSPQREDCLRNLEVILSEFPQDVIRFILVDSGSEAAAASEVEAICTKYGATYTYIDTGNETFSIGKARDHGVRISTAKYILFHDVDLLPYISFYEEILVLIKERFREGVDEVINIPCIYLSERASAEYKDISPEGRKSYLHDCIKMGDDRVEFYAASSSVAIFDRYYYCTLGGHDPRFQGHGCEDFELFYRAYSNNPRFPKPANIYSNDGHWSAQSYSGFRSWYRKYGDETALNGIFIAHLWHEREGQSDNYVRRSRDNKDLLKQCMVDFDQRESCWLPPIPFNENKTLFLGVEGSEFSESIREFLPLLGYIDYQRESFFDSEFEFHGYISSGNIEQVFFHNPYANEKRRALYKYCRVNNIPYVVYERGALPGSVFFDTNGFNFDSSSYREENWDKNLSEEELSSIKAYCKLEIENESYLEWQSRKMGQDYIRNKYGINGKKVCLVPLQRPDDTVCKLFKGPLKSYSEFYTWVENISASLKDWVFLIKTHPLEEKEDYPFDKNDNVHNCDKDNIKDLMDTADSVLLLNSGVGLLSILRMKNVVCVGDAFYSHKGLCNRARSPEEAKDLISREWKPDVLRVYKFLSYLVNDFYSFGRFSTKTVDRDGSKITITSNVKFESIKVSTQGVRIRFNARRKPLFSESSYLLGVKFSRVIIPENKASCTINRKPDITLILKRAIKYLIWKSVGAENGVGIVSSIYSLLGRKKAVSRSI